MEKLPCPQSNSLTAEAAEVATPDAAVERVMDDLAGEDGPAVLPAEDAVAAEASATGAAREMAAGFFRSAPAGETGLLGRNAISLRSRTATAGAVVALILLILMIGWA